MLSERDIELAHPDAFDYVWGNLPSAKRAEFNRHLGTCRYCQAVVGEYGEIGRIIKLLPPHVEPPADLEERIVGAMTAALAEQRARPELAGDAEDRTATRIHVIPQRPSSDELVTEVHQRPAEPPPDLAADRPALDPAPAPAQPMVTRLPVWRRYRRRLAAAAAVAAAIITAAIVVPLSLSGGGVATAQSPVVIPLHVTAAAKVIGYGAATGRATARQNPSGSWDITLTVAHLKHFDPAPWYGCWYVSRDGRQVTSAGTFLVPSSGGGTFTMTSAVDPHDFPTMEITRQPPNKDGALAGTVILAGQKL